MTAEIYVPYVPRQVNYLGISSSGTTTFFGGGRGQGGGGAGVLTGAISHYTHGAGLKNGSVNKH